VKWKKRLFSTRIIKLMAAEIKNMITQTSHFSSSELVKGHLPKEIK